MSLNANNANLRSIQSFSLFHGSSNSLRVREFRVYRRRRLKRSRRLNLRSEWAPFGDLLASASSLELLAPAFGIASGLAAFAARVGSGRRASEACDIGEWVLFASPTPFNRFVLLRCPSVAFEGGELLEGVSERLVREDRHYVRLCSGRVLVREGLEGVIGDLEGKLEYQRVCVSTDDGGVVSLDWPANLDIRGEHGLDTTVLVVPGTVQGSMDADIRSFVCEALRRGCFPIVMNPRGCAGSPLTTARLFTAADSDDIGTAIQFINRARPWTTLMGVGLGYGANMLTKYLAEVGEGTPLTAAVCIDNPFDLEEATKSYPHHMGVDQKLTGGLVDILRSNKELFQGRAKGFDVEKALSAKSVRDFEQAISMVSYGFEAVEEFYSKSSTRNLIGDVKIPLLFMQSDDCSAPLFSIPRSSIAENPFTSLLLCSCNPSSGFYRVGSALTWCRQFAIEWLVAVELGLLKGRHPLLEDVDVTINPSKGLAFLEGISSNNTDKITKLLDITASSGYRANHINDMLEESDTAAGLILRSRKELEQGYKFKTKGLQKLENGAMEEIMPADEELVEEDIESPTEIESGEAVQTAQVVMHMLDATMPGTLTEDKKKKVLTAVGQGETVMKALQDAVPGDVREKLTTAVTGILQSQNTQLKIKELLRASRIPNLSSGSTPKMEEKMREASNEGPSQEHPSSDQTKKADSLLDGSVNTQPGVSMPSEGTEAEHLQSESSQKSANIEQSQSTSEGSGSSGSARNETTDSKNNDNFDDNLKGKVRQNSESVDRGLETGVNANSSSNIEKVGNAAELRVEENKDQAGDLSDKKEENSAKDEEKPVPDQSKTTPGGVAENASPSGSSSEAQKEDSDNQKRENKNPDPAPDQSKSNPVAASPTFSVSQALDALTGMDDSTQVAVNSVFGVIEDMIVQLEEASPDENGVKDEKDDPGPALENEKTIDDQGLKNSKSTGHEQNVKIDISGGSSDNIHHESMCDSPNGSVEKKSAQSTISLYGNDLKTFPKRDQLAPKNLLSDSSNRIKQVDDTPASVTSDTYSNSFNNGYLHNTLLSEIPKESLDSDATSALLLEYFPEEGQWKLLEQPGNNGTQDDDVGTKSHASSPDNGDSGDDVIEPLYAILETEEQQEPVEEFEMDQQNEKVEIAESLSEFIQFVKGIILDDLKVEVSRKLGLAQIEEIDSNLARDLEQVSNEVSMSIACDAKIACSDDENLDINGTLEKVDTLNGEHVIRSISSAVQDTTYLRRILPVGVVVGSSLAALRKFFNVSTVHDDGDAPNFNDRKNLRENGQSKVKVAETQKMPSPKPTQSRKSDDLVRNKEEEKEPTSNKKTTAMVGAVTAALGASALLAQHQDSQKTDEALIDSSKFSKMKADNQKEPDKLEDAMSERNHHNLVTSLAEKAMSVAGPVVPTKEDGGVDQERLVAMLADLGQKGGILRLVGKVALLWGGIRGAMSLTNRLISFLHIAERPLIQRALGFACMVLVLWSPVAVPLLPSLVQSWTTKTPSRISELACVVGLYIAIVMLIMLWGKRIRGYENPPEQYGLDLTSLPKIYNFGMGLIGGILLVLSIQAVNASLGCLSLSWPYTVTSQDAISLIKVYGQMVMVIGQGLVTATGVAVVEELLFRSWLPEEIAADLGYHRGVIISGLVFSLLQRSPWSIPGLWLLSLSLSAIRQISEGSLSVVIGLRAGILASSFILQRGGFLTYKPNFPLWLTGTHPFQPFSGITGFAFSLVLALFLYLRQPLQTKGTKRKIRE